MRFLSHLLYVGSGHNELLDNFLILAEFVRQFAKLVLELVQFHVLNVQVVLGVLLDVSDLRHIIVIFCVVSIIRITVIFVGSLDIKGYCKNIIPFWNRVLITVTISLMRASRSDLAEKYFGNLGFRGSLSGKVCVRFI